MTLLFTDGFDVQDWAVKGWVGSTASWVADATTPFGSGYALRGNRSSTVAALSKAITASAQVFFGFQFASVNVAVAEYGFCGIAADSGGTRHLTLTVDLSTGALNLYRGSASGTLIASSAGGVVLGDGAYREIEVSATIADSGGTCVVKVNGTTVINFTGDTKNAGTSTNIDAVLLFNPGAAASTTQYHLFDDLYICNALGARNNSFLGPCRVQTLLSTGAGSSTQFTPVSGSNWSNVNDVPDNTATYNSDTVSGHRDTYAMADLVTGTDTIFGIQQVMHARQLDGGTATIKQAQKSGATVSYGSTKTLSASNAAYADIFETNPATAAAYTQTEVNALEAGAEIV